MRLDLLNARDGCLGDLLAANQLRLDRSSNANRV
jgi:hypothetical protein